MIRTKVYGRHFFFFLLLLYVIPWMNLTDIILNKIRQTQEYILNDSIYMSLSKPEEKFLSLFEPNR